MKTIALLILLVCSQAFANGSSGVGTARTMITDGTAAALPDGFIQVQNSQITDGVQPILSLSAVNRSDLGDGWVRVRLGAVDGYEFWPSQGSGAPNAWVFCEKSSDSCTKLLPLSSKNRKIPAVIGSLIQGAPQPAGADVPPPPKEKLGPPPGLVLGPSQ